MKILVTGSNGFIGKNLVIVLKALGHEVFSYDIDNSLEELKQFVSKADFIIHLAGVNRPKEVKEFAGNYSSLEHVINFHKECNQKCPILLSSSTQAALDNEYGKSKLEAEKALLSYQKASKTPVFVFRLANVFGKWCRPNYNSVVATFCYNIANGLEVNVNEQAPQIEFVYVDDVVNCFIEKLNEQKGSENILSVSPSYKSTPKEIKDLLVSFKEGRNTYQLPIQEGFIKKLYATYTSYIPQNEMSYDAIMHVDNRGSFTELFKTPNYGQTSVNIIKPGITKGNHFHMSKNEKYVVVSGTCSTKFRKVDTDEVIEVISSGEKIEIIDIPTGYTHCITNIGKDQDAVVIMWANEAFDPNVPDTYFEVVEK